MGSPNYETFFEPMHAVRHESIFFANVEVLGHVFVIS
jgi:hypothetical protein